MERELTPTTKQAPPPHTASPSPQAPPEIAARDGTTLAHAEDFRKKKKNITSLLVPEAPPSGLPDRYMSPTDCIISPVSSRLLARNRKGALPQQGKIPPQVAHPLQLITDVEPLSSVTSGPD